MAESQDVNTLRRRGRRRLVGAIALVLLAAIVLPMVFDPEPRPGAPPVSVRIPGEDDVRFAPKVTPKSPPLPQVSATPLAPHGADGTAPEKLLADKPGTEKPAAAAPAPTKADTAEARREPAPAVPAPAGEQYVVQVGAFADPAGVIGKLKTARLPYYTEPVAVAKGRVTRVRAGPFASREAAQKAQDQLQGLGFKPGNVLAKP